MSLRRENIAGSRNGVAFYLYSCYLYLTGVGISTLFAGKVKMEFRNGANQRNLDAFVFGSFFCISHMGVYRDLSDGAGDRESLFL